MSETRPTAEQEARKALKCLYLEVPSSIADDVKAHVEAWVEAAASSAREEVRELREALRDGPKIATVVVRGDPPELLPIVSTRMTDAGVQVIVGRPVLSPPPSAGKPEPSEAKHPDAEPRLIYSVKHKRYCLLPQVEHFYDAASAVSALRIATARTRDGRTRSRGERKA